MRRDYEVIVPDEDIKEKEVLEIEYLLYKDKYIDVIRIFLQNNKRIQQEKQGSYESGEDMLRAYENFPHDMSNIITIVGGRGSGKTTVMQEICSIFQKFDNKKHEWVKRLGKPHLEELQSQAKQNFKFSVMEVIDTSVLEEKDDLLEMILWHIYDNVKEKINVDIKEGKRSAAEWERQKFVDTLDEVYKMHQSVKGMAGGGVKGESAITELENMPNSIKTRKAMHKLLDLYCKIMFPDREQNAYLVIAIDDLDLNIKKSYQMLEEICRYLLDWRIIVLLAVDNKQMQEVCITHFCDEFGVKRYDSMEGNLGQHIHKLSNSYLVKVMVPQNRIYLSKEELQMAQIREVRGGESKTLDIKKYLLAYISSKMHMFYDAYGLKKHFCEPDTIRELICYIEFLKSLHTVEWNVPEGVQAEKYLEKQLKYYIQNSTRFYQDIVGRMAFQVLQFEQNDIFTEIRERDLERRTGYVMQWYTNTLQKRGTVKAIAEMEHYDFGEFLGCIYNWGRKDYEYKALVHCLIASFTTEMTREYFNYHYNWMEQESAERSKRRLEGYVGDNVSGGWFSEAMGEVFWTEKVKRKKVNNNDGPIKIDEYEIEDQENRKFISIEKEKELQYIPFAFEIEDLGNRKTRGAYLHILNQFIELKILPILECIFMFLNNYKINKDGRNCTPQIKITQEHAPKIIGKTSGRTGIKLTIQILEAKYADFDILGFIKKSIDYEEWKRNIGNSLVDELMREAKAISEYTVPEDKMPEKIKSTISKFKNTSIFAGEENSKSKMALPLYDLDLSYNVLKRVRRECQREFSIPVEINNVLDRILRVYQLIETELENEKKRYDDFGGNEFRYKKIFMDDPYIKKFKDLLSDKKSKDNFLNQIKMLYLGTGKIDELSRVNLNLNVE